MPVSTFRWKVLCGRVWRGFFTFLTSTISKSNSTKKTLQILGFLKEKNPNDGQWSPPVILLFCWNFWVMTAELWVNWSTIWSPPVILFRVLPAPVSAIQTKVLNALWLLLIVQQLNLILVIITIITTITHHSMVIMVIAPPSSHHHHHHDPHHHHRDAIVHLFNLLLATLASHQGCGSQDNARRVHFHLPSLVVITVRWSRNWSGLR